MPEINPNLAQFLRSEAAAWIFAVSFTGLVIFLSSLPDIIKNHNNKTKTKPDYLRGCPFFDDDR